MKYLIKKVKILNKTSKEVKNIIKRKKIIINKTKKVIIRENSNKWIINENM